VVVEYTGLFAEDLRDERKASGDGGGSDWMW